MTQGTATGHQGPWATVEEAVGVLEHLESAGALSSRQLRYLDVRGAVPVGRVERDAARLYQPVDVMLLRVVIRAAARGVSMPQISAALRYLGEDVRAGLLQGRAVALVFDWRGVARLVPVSHAASDAQAVIALGDCARGVVAAMRAARRADPDGAKPAAWNGWRSVVGVPAPAMA